MPRTLPCHSKENGPTFELHGSPTIFFNRVSEKTNGERQPGPIGSTPA